MIRMLVVTSLLLVFVHRIEIKVNVLPYSFYVHAGVDVHQEDGNGKTKFSLGFFLLL